MIHFNLFFITFLIFSNAFAKPRVMEIVIPQNNESPPTEFVDNEDSEMRDVFPMKIILAANDRIYWYVGAPDYENYESLKEIGYEELQATLKKHHANKPIAIMSTKDATYKNLVDMLDVMRICNIPRYTVTDITDAEEFLIENYETKGALSDSLATTPQ